MDCFSLWLQLIFPDLVEGLVLVNVDPNGKGWIDWAATKVSRLLFPNRSPFDGGSLVSS